MNLLLKNHLLAICLLLGIAVTSNPMLLADAAEPSPANLIINGDVSNADADGGPEHWSIRVRKGNCELKRIEVDPGQITDNSDKQAADIRHAAQIIAKGDDGFSFKLQAGMLPKGYEVSVTNDTRTLRLTAWAKVEAEGKFTALFRLGQDDHAKYVKLDPNAKWTKIKALVEVPAHQPFGRYDFSCSGTGTASITLADIRLELNDSAVASGMSKADR